MLHGTGSGSYLGLHPAYRLEPVEGGVAHEMPPIWARLSRPQRSVLYQHQAVPVCISSESWSPLGHQSRRVAMSLWEDSQFGTWAPRRAGGTFARVPFVVGLRGGPSPGLESRWVRSQACAGGIGSIKAGSCASICPAGPTIYSVHGVDQGPGPFCHVLEGDSGRFGFATARRWRLNAFPRSWEACHRDGSKW